MIIKTLKMSARKRNWWNVRSLFTR